MELVEDPLSKLKKIHVSCEKCGMKDIYYDKPAIVNRLVKEWKRQHEHATMKKPSLLERLGVKINNG